MTPQDPAHAHSVQRLSELLTLALRGRAVIRTRSLLALLDDSEPEPDVAVVPSGDYSASHPAHAHLVIEVSGSSQRRDRLVKGPIYARAGVQEYWLVDLDTRVADVHRDPQGARYVTVMRVSDSESLRPLRFADVEIPMREILPTRT
jgi:Uma2 family endonuclease